MKEFYVKVETAMKLLIMREDRASENGRSMLQTRPSMFEFTTSSEPWHQSDTSWLDSIYLLGISKIFSVDIWKHKFCRQGSASIHSFPESMSSFTINGWNAEMQRNRAHRCMMGIHLRKRKVRSGEEGGLKREIMIFSELFHNLILFLNVWRMNPLHPKYSWDQGFSNLIFKGPNLIFRRGKGPEELVKSKCLLLNLLTTFNFGVTHAVRLQLFCSWTSAAPMFLWEV